jgi:hypothetical protein
MVNEVNMLHSDLYELSLEDTQNLNRLHQPNFITSLLLLVMFKDHLHIIEPLMVYLMDMLKNFKPCIFCELLTCEHES